MCEELHPSFFYSNSSIILFSTGMQDKLGVHHHVDIWLIDHVLQELTKHMYFPHSGAAKKLQWLLIREHKAGTSLNLAKNCSPVDELTVPIHVEGRAKTPTLLRCRLLVHRTTRPLRVPFAHAPTDDVLVTDSVFVSSLTYFRILLPFSVGWFRVLTPKFLRTQN